MVNANGTTNLATSIRPECEGSPDREGSPKVGDSVTHMTNNKTLKT